MLEVTNEVIEKYREANKGNRYTKLPVEIEAFQMTVDFEVDTLEGKMKGYIGDYLIIGVDGEPYPCKKEIFEKTYRLI